MPRSANHNEDVPRGEATRANLAYAYQHYGPTWVSCGFWILSLCPWWCQGAKGHCAGHPYTGDPQEDVERP